MAWIKLSILCSFALMLHSVAAIPNAPYLVKLNERDNPPLQWGTIGDSWDAGVAWTKQTAYDNNKGYCLRYTNAWSLQMSRDNSWVTNGQHFTFAGCSGAQLPAMVSDYGKGKSQLNEIKKPLLLAMMAGGNDAGFGKAVDGCFYHGQPGGSYGPPWDKDPKGEGDCKKQIKNAQDYVNSDSKEDRKGLRHDITTTIDQVMKVIAHQGTKEFALYIPGYAQFFNDQTDECDHWSFAPWWAGQKPNVVKPVRKIFNDTIKKFNSIYRDVIENYKMPDGVPKQGFSVHFVSIDEGFEGGRFCEDGASFEDQWYDPKTLIWNLNPAEAYWTAPDDGPYPHPANTTIVNGTKYLINGQSYHPPQNFSVMSGSSQRVVLSQGWTAKPFHPKKGGHSAISKLMIEQIQKDAAVPGIKKANAVSCGGNNGSGGCTTKTPEPSSTHNTKHTPEPKPTPTPSTTKHHNPSHTTSHQTIDTILTSPPPSIITTTLKPTESFIPPIIPIPVA